MYSKNTASVDQYYFAPAGGECHTAELVRLKYRGLLL